jgi:HK97 family phage major capsid protein/HK97 family phage prohead protease
MKSMSSNGVFSGYASIFDEPDHDKDVILPGAFKKSLQALQVKNKRPKLLWQHDATTPIGRWEEIREDHRGLFVSGRLFLDVAKGKEVYTLLKEREVDGLSIGFVSKHHQPNEAGGQTFHEVELLEVSLVTFPAHPGAQVEHVKYNPLIHKEIDMIEKRHLSQNRPEVALATKETDTNFDNFIRSGYRSKSLTTLEESRGGFLIPEILQDRLMSSIESLSPFRKLARTLSISSSAVDVLLTSSIPDAGWVAEEDDRNNTRAGEIKKLTIPVHEIYAKPRATQKLLDDAKVDVESWLLRGVAEKIARMETEAFLIGDGNKKPHGLLTHQTTDLTSGEAEKIGLLKTGVLGGFPDDKAADLLIDLMQSLKTTYLPGACWVMSRSALAAIRKLKEKTTDNYLWQPGLSDHPSTLLGHPVVLCDAMPALQPGTASVSVAFGNFSEAYQIVDRAGIHILRDPYSAKPYVEFYVTKRVGGAVVNPEAVKLLSFDTA